jgi:DNA-binding MarR family transcriptional regulator
VSKAALPLDHAGRALTAWQEARPDLDLSPAFVLARVRRLMSLLEPALEPPLAGYGLNHAGFDTLSALRRAGPPYTLSAHDLAAHCLRTPATLSARIARLCKDGLVTRAPDPNDGRGVLISLTESGLQLIDAVAPAYLATEKLLLAGIDDTQRDALAEILHVLLLSFEGFDEPGGETATGQVPKLGAQLKSLHATLSMRRAVGVKDRIGLLVDSVSPGGPASMAGLARGDLVVAIDGQTVRSLPQVNHLIDRAAGAVTVTVAREGKRDRQVTVSLP